MRGVSIVGRLVRNTARRSSIGEYAVAAATAAAVYSSCNNPAAISYTCCLSEPSPLIAPITTVSSSVHKFHSAQSSFSRNFSSSSSDQSKLVLIESENQLNDSLRKAQDESLPALFYFTAAWCGPCRMVSPIIEQLSKKYPNVAMYKIDIDQEDLLNALSKLNISAVPTFRFFKNGKKESEIVGANVEGLKDTMESLYK